MDNEREMTADDDTERAPWERAVVLVEADEADEIEEGGEEEAGEPEAEQLQDHSQLVEAEEGEASPDALASDAQIAEITALLRESGDDFDIGGYVAAIREAGAGEIAVAPEDFPLLVSYVEELSEGGVDPAAIGRSVAWYLKMQDGASEQRHEADAAERDRMIGELESQWGRNYKANIGELKYLMRSMPNGVGDALQAARMPDGTLLINTPGFPDVFLQLAKSGARPTPNPKERLEAISETLKSDPQKYFREKMDEEALALRRGMERGPSQTASGPQAAQINRQLTEINKVLRADPQRYWREGMSDRATELRRQLEQINAAAASRGG